MKPTASQIRRQFIDFFAKKYGHKEIPSASLIPENDPTVLFTTAGMHPLVPYLMGEPHPEGKRLVDVQKCIRTVDIDEVGDASHCTFFEMLGNWSLGDYFKKEAIEWSYEFLTSPDFLNLDKRKLSVTVFGGDKRVPQVPRDDEAASVWKSLGMPEDRIAFMPGGVFEREDNWWGPAGDTGPCGPSTEMFYWVGESEFPPVGSNVSTDKNNWLEIWNDVFMQFNRMEGEKFEPLKQKNVDTGMGLERVLAMLQGKKSVYDTELFAPVIQKIHSLIPESTESSSSHQRSIRIIADHIKAAAFILGDPQSVSPSNVDQGYIVRRLIRRAIREAKRLGIEMSFTAYIVEIYVSLYQDVYPELSKNQERIVGEFNKEEAQFKKTLEKGLKEVARLIKEKGILDGADVFYLFETYGFPPEMTEEEMLRQGSLDSLTQMKDAAGQMDNKLKSIKAGFDEAFKKHQALSRVGAEQKFSGGLADDSEQCKMHHTATHLVHQALRDVLGTHVYQRGSNITKERLRFDFVQPQKMTPEEVKKVEDIVNEQIAADLPIHFEIFEVAEAKKRGAIGIFDDKYATLGNKVKVYVMGPPANNPTIRPYSMEVCGGPHVEHTGTLKHFRILKEEACSAGIRRIKAVVEGIKDVV